MQFLERFTKCEALSISFITLLESVLSGHEMITKPANLRSHSSSSLVSSRACCGVRRPNSFHPSARTRAPLRDISRYTESYVDGMFEN